MTKTIHIPILVKPIIKGLFEPLLNSASPLSTSWIVDCTLGGGGHTAAILEEIANHPILHSLKVLSLDQDEKAIENTKIRFKEEIHNGKLEIVRKRFGDAKDLVSSRPVVGLLADLGFSSDQLEDANRGLSFQAHGPLDMRLDPSRGLSCSEYLDEVSEVELERVLREYGEERFSRRIASFIISYRNKNHAPQTTQELVDLVVRATPPQKRHGRIHVATRTFQALRIAVNDELSELDQLLNDVIIHVRTQGRIAIMSFHSLEDRKVKIKFKEQELFHSLTKKPLQASEQEIEENPRARSAKLRIAERK